MKKLLIIAIAFISFQAIAQEHHKPNRKEMKREYFKDMSAEDMATLKTKKLTLMLDLDDSQAKKVYNVVLGESKFLKEKMASKEDKKDKKKEFSKEEKLKLANERLDRKIAFKRAMKSILNDEQYKRFERSLSKNEKRKKAAIHKRRS